jgi:hypothetical protein
MSDVFEGILCPGTPEQVSNTVDRTAGGLSLKLRPLDNRVTAVYRSDVRNTSFSERINEVAQNLSKERGKALLVRFDGRISHRSSVLFVDGKEIRDFTEEDEIYVLLGDRGKPLTEGRKFTFAEMAAADPDEEFATFCDAIQLGLDAFGIGTWEETMELVGTT